MTQRQSIDQALALDREGIDVWGPPELMLMNERYCTEEGKPAVVTYHPNTVRTNHGGYVCPDCGKATDYAGEA